MATAWEVDAVLPLCDGGLPHVLGFVRSPQILNELLTGRPVDLKALAEPPLFVPASVMVMKLLEQFKRAHLPLALVVDEFGGVEGLVSLTDVMGSLVGEMAPGPGEEPSIVRREDGSWLLDGALDLDTVLRTLGADAQLSDLDRQHYHTAAIAPIACWPAGFLRRCHLRRHRLQTERPPGS